MHKLPKEKKQNKQISPTKSVRDKFQEQKSGNSNSHDQNQFLEEKNQCTSFMKRKINMGQVFRPTISTQQVLWTKPVS